MISTKKPMMTPDELYQTGRLRFIWNEAVHGNFQPGFDAGINQENMERLAALSESEVDVLAEGVDIIFRDVDPETGDIIPYKTH